MLGHNIGFLPAAIFDHNISTALEKENLNWFLFYFLSRKNIISIYLRA